MSEAVRVKYVSDILSSTQKLPLTLPTLYCVPKESKESN